MARIRSIKPEFWTDATIVQLPFEARLLFIGLWNFCDDDGYISDEPDQIRLQILPNDNIDCDLLIDLLVASELIDRIVLSDGKQILKIVNFSKHQRISHRTSTKFQLTGAEKKRIPDGLRRQLAIKYGCQPGNTLEASCYYCGTPGLIKWWALSNGKPSGWVSFSGLEIAHFAPENSGGETDEKNLVLSCRYCNRSKGTNEGIEFIQKKISTPPENSGALRPEGRGREGKGKEGKGEEGKGEGARARAHPPTQGGKELSVVESSYQPSPAILARIRMAGCRDPGDDDVQQFIAHYEAKGSLVKNWDAKFLQWMIRQKNYDATSAAKSGRRHGTVGKTFDDYHQGNSKDGKLVEGELA